MARGKHGSSKLILVLYDIFILGVIDVLLLFFYGGGTVRLTTAEAMGHVAVSAVAILGCRFGFGIYKAIWRYGGVQTYMKLMVSDALAFVLYFIASSILHLKQITFVRMLALVMMNLFCALAMRMAYRYCYKCASPDTVWGRFLSVLLRVFAGVTNNRKAEHGGIKVAILGAGNLGFTLYEDIYVNKQYSYEVRCFIDDDNSKRGRYLNGIKVLSGEEASAARLISDYGVQEIIVAIRDFGQEKLKAVYEKYTPAGIKVKHYDVLNNVQNASSKGYLREVQIEDLLFRKPVVMQADEVKAYYRDKVILVTGGAGSIGSELCRQVASYGPKTLVVLDIYENTAYDLQQELKMLYGKALDFHVEICSITNKEAVRRVFEKYKPQIIINAAAHKHVPLMEDDAQEAIENNVFGCKNLLDLTREYNVERFMMVSTDKAVNPTNVMGATKRLCEMMVLSAAKESGSSISCVASGNVGEQETRGCDGTTQAHECDGAVKADVACGCDEAIEAHGHDAGQTIYSCTRFGNVLGSAGSVIPLFKRQIAKGGPVTITDKRITRYFMTIPEASQLVLQSGQMAKNGELFVLDMGQPVKIYDLAQNMIRLSGATNVDIVEIGLRPGEKLYEELLIKSETLTKTANNLIFIEKDEPLAASEIDAKLECLAQMEAKKLSNDEVKALFRKVVPTYKTPEEVNCNVK